MPPPPPHELGKHPHPPVPPHERKRRGLSKRLLFSIVIGVAVTTVISIVLWLFGISINIILPVAASIVVGSTTLTCTALADRI